ncbi:amidohydrolase family protein [Streptomyces sp. GD-15H]|uniref:amidohydrolase family protein n=1 Tax=Streptomyces sp. GD-15H TaxID=3129112 RepID=UPI00325187DE
MAFNGIPVIDGVVHAYNFTKENTVDDPVQADWAARYTEGAHRNHRQYYKSHSDEFTMSAEEFKGDLSAEALAETVFLESDVDIAVYHSLPMFHLFKDGLASLEKGLELKRKYPGRFVVYAAIEPLKGNKCLETMEQYAELGVDGFKMYPSTFYHGESTGFYMDDPNAAFPVFQKALDLGVRNVAVHKGRPLGPGEIGPFHTSDLIGAAGKFPDLNFQIIHGGLTFNEETADVLHRYKNVYVTLESTLNYTYTAPRFVQEALGLFLYRARPEQLIFATGCNLVHPQPVIEGFWNMQMPEDLMLGFGYPELTDDIKKMILSENFARLHDLDVTGTKSERDRDRFGKALEGSGGQKLRPWSVLRDVRTPHAQEPTHV